MKLSQALKLAKRRIELRRNAYICGALGDVGAHQFQTFVMQQLGPSFSYEGWLRRHHWETYNRMTNEDKRQGRLQWLDHMIKEAEANGQ